jgi:hypothetical protein
MRARYARRSAKLNAKKQVDNLTGMEWELPHWLILAGTLLVIAGLIGVLMKRRQQAKVQDDPTTEPRPQLPPLPDLLDSRPRKNRRSPSDEEHPPSPPHGEIGLKAKKT